MPESFLILLAGGIMLAAAVSDPQQVTLNWLRLCGILALAMAGLSTFFLYRRGEPVPLATALANACVFAAIAGQLAFVQLAFRRTQQILAWLAFFLSVKVAAAADYTPADPLVAYASSLGIAAMCGLALMDMLLGHAYLTASKMTIAPFTRLNAFLAGTLIWRTILAVGVTMLIAHFHPIYMLWGQHGLFILTRWLVGLCVPAVFVYMAHDCIRRRSTQSATGILYVAGVLIFIGEIVALYLVRATGLPF
jgi:hypothetical protein